MQNEFLAKRWSLDGLNRLVQKIDETGSADVKKGARGRPCTARTADNIATVDEMILSQEDRPRTHPTVRQITQETGITKSSVHRIVHRELSHKCYKKKCGLTAANKI